MAVESASDRAAFLNPDEFGVSAVFDGSTVEGVLLNAAISVEIGAGVPVESTAPVFVCREADVPDVAHGDYLTVDGVVWTVCGVSPDGTGMVRLDLNDEN